MGRCLQLDENCRSIPGNLGFSDCRKVIADDRSVRVGSKSSDTPYSQPCRNTTHVAVESVIGYTYFYIPIPLFLFHMYKLDHDEAGVSSSAGTTTPFSSNIFAKEPSLCMLIKISHPPTNSLSTYNWGIVGQSEYSLIPIVQSLAFDYRMRKYPCNSIHLSFCIVKAVEGIWES